MSSISSASSPTLKVCLTEEAAAVILQRTYREHWQKVMSTIWGSFMEAQDEDGLASSIRLVTKFPVLLHFKDSDAYKLMKVLIEDNQISAKIDCQVEYFQEILNFRNFYSSLAQEKVKIIVDLFLNMPCPPEAKKLLLESLPTNEDMEKEPIKNEEIKLLYCILSKVKHLNQSLEEQPSYEPFFLCEAYSPFRDCSNPRNSSSSAAQRKLFQEDTPISNPAQRPFLKITLFALLLISTCAFLYKNRSRLSTYYKDIKKLTGRF